MGASRPRVARWSQRRKVTRSQEPPPVPRLCQPWEERRAKSSWGPAALGWPRGALRRPRAQPRLTQPWHVQRPFAFRSSNSHSQPPAEGVWPPLLGVRAPCALLSAPSPPSCLRASVPSCLCRRWGPAAPGWPDGHKVTRSQSHKHRRLPVRRAVLLAPCPLSLVPAPCTPVPSGPASPTISPWTSTSWSPAVSGAIARPGGCSTNGSWGRSTDLRFV